MSQFYQIEAFRSIFCSIVFKYTTQNNTEVLLNDVEKRYSAMGRHYHNMDHIMSMIAEWQCFKDRLKNSDEVFMAIIYHDIIYKPRRGDNEEKSAEYFKGIVSKGLHLEQSFVKNVCDAILATKHKESSKALYANNSDIKFLLDFDLCILGTGLYDKYREGIRKEYWIYPNFMYKPGRKKVLESFLSRESIYLTKEFKIFENIARENMLKEINTYLC